MYVPGGGLIRLNELAPTLADSEAKIAEYILAHPDELLSMTVQELAKQSGGSPSAVVRLWKSLGFDSFHDFKFRVVSDLQADVVGGYDELKPGSSFTSVVRLIEENFIHSIQNTFRLLKETDIEESVDALFEAGRIVIFGVGASSVVAKDLSQKLSRVGFFNQEATDFHTAATLAAQLKSSDVLIVVSDSGKTSDIVEVAEVAKGKGAFILAITRFGETPLSRLASKCLNISSIEPDIRIAATASRISALAVVDSLFFYLVNHSNRRIFNSLEASRDAVKSHKLS